MTTARDNTAIALTIAEHMLTAATKAVEVINRARAEGRTVSDAELHNLASLDDIERARLAAEIAKQRAGG